jgi:2-polyprenyl-3-methyl-5-hydroxy-6-metoxy-1,4-benzoquinol methylase
MEKCNKIETVNRCPNCNKEGAIKYKRFNGALYKKTEGYELSQCTNINCGSSWLSRRIKQEFVYEAYNSYPTLYKKPSKNGIKQRVRDYIKKSYLSKEYGYYYKNWGFGYFLAKTLSFIIPSGTHGLDSECFFIKNQYNKKVLEIGCGNGINLLKLKNLGYDVSGIEIDSRSAKVASECGINVMCTSVEEFTPNEKYDIILMHHVIEHLYDLKKAINIIKKALKSDGTLYIFTPNSDSFGEYIYKESWFPLDPPRHVTLFNEKSINNFLMESGFNKITTFTSLKDVLPYHIFSQQIKLKQITSLKIKSSIKSLIYGLITSYIEKSLYFFVKNKGGELVCIARK